MIRQRGRTWQVRVYVGTDPATGKRKHLYGTAASKRAARILEGDLERQAAQITPATATVDYMLDKWLAVARHAPSTACDTKGRLDRHVRPTLGAQKVTAITTELPRRLLPRPRAPRRRPRVDQTNPWDAARCVHPSGPVGVDPTQPRPRLPLAGSANPTPVAPSPDALRTLLLAGAPCDFATFLASSP
jgi:hypothetical protein